MKAKENKSTLEKLAPSDFSGLELVDFFPYQVRIFYRAVTNAMAQVYGPMYNLSISEWRVMAVLSPNHTLSASEIVKRSSMTKVNVSRATISMQKRGLLKRDIDGNDKRYAALRLTERGTQVFKDLRPYISELENDLFTGLTAQETQLLVSLMEKVRSNAEKFVSDHPELSPNRD